MTKLKSWVDRLREVWRRAGRGLTAAEALAIARAHVDENGGNGQFVTAGVYGWRTLTFWSCHRNFRVVIDRYTGEVVEYRQFPR